MRRNDHNRDQFDHNKAAFLFHLPFAETLSQKEFTAQSADSARDMRCSHTMN